MKAQLGPAGPRAGPALRQVRLAWRQALPARWHTLIRFCAPVGFWLALCVAANGIDVEGRGSAERMGVGAAGENPERRTPAQPAGFAASAPLETGVIPAGGASLLAAAEAVVLDLAGSGRPVTQENLLAAVNRAGGLFGVPPCRLRALALCILKFFDDQNLAALPVPAGLDYAFEWAGDFWHLTFEGQTTHVRDGVGPRYIALLLANPGKELFCPDIIAIARGNPTAKISQAKDILADDRAIGEWRGHLRELTAELDEAKEFNDWGRQEKLQAKADFLKEHLLKLRGLRGKTRTFSGSFDNARVSVANAIRRTLDREAIKENLPNAWRHLDRSISRGAFMSYDPETPIDWVLSAEKNQVLHDL